MDSNQFTYKKTQVNIMDTKTGSILLLHTKNTIQSQRQALTQNKGLEKDIPIKWTEEKAGVATLISNKIDFKLKSIKRDGEGHSYSSAEKPIKSKSQF